MLEINKETRKIKSAQTLRIMWKPKEKKTTEREREASTIIRENYNGGLSYLMK